MNNSGSLIENIVYTMLLIQAKAIVVLILPNLTIKIPGIQLIILASRFALPYSIIKNNIRIVS
jgi:hypothetical protein